MVLLWYEGGESLIFHGDLIMSVYRSLLAAVAALAISVPAFADDATTGSNDQAAQPAQAASQQSSDASQQQTKVDINKATLKELAKVKGISPAKAKAIIAYRKKNGDFKTLDDLKNVKGFKKLNDGQLKQIQDQLTAS